MTDAQKLSRAEHMDLMRENERLRKQIEKHAIRFDHCSDMIASGFGISGTLRAERTSKARLYAMDARDALSNAGFDAAVIREGFNG